MKLLVVIVLLVLLGFDKAFLDFVKDLLLLLLFLWDLDRDFRDYWLFVHVELFVFFVHFNLGLNLVVELFFIISIKCLNNLLLALFGGSRDLSLDILLQVRVQLALKQRLELCIRMVFLLTSFPNLLRHTFALRLIVDGVVDRNLLVLYLLNLRLWLLFLQFLFELIFKLYLK